MDRVLIARYLEMLGVCRSIPGHTGSLVLALTMMGIELARNSAASPPPSANQFALVQAAALEPPDASLPTGAVLRLGTMEFNHGDGLEQLHFSPDGKKIISVGGG